MFPPQMSILFQAGYIDWVCHKTLHSLHSCDYSWREQCACPTLLNLQVHTIVLYCGVWEGTIQMP